MIGIKIDMPKRCGECPIERIVMSTSYVCQITREITNDIREEIRGNHCPLCELPEDDKIRVGDEVHNFDKHGIVTFIWKDGDVDVVKKNGMVETWEKDGIERTGRHFDVVEALLKEIRGEYDG